LEAPYAESPAASIVSKLVVTVTMRPQPRSIMGRAAKCAIRNAPIVLTATMRRQPSGIRFEEFDPGVSLPGRGGHADAGAIDQDVERAEALEHSLDCLPAVRGLGYIANGVETSSGKDRFGGEPIEAGCIDVDGCDLGAGIRKRACHDASHAARRSGDRGDAAGKRSFSRHDACLPREP
jgi:hypothetical protein